MCSAIRILQERSDLVEYNWVGNWTQNKIHAKSYFYCRTCFEEKLIQVIKSSRGPIPRVFPKEKIRGKVRSIFTCFYLLSRLLNDVLEVGMSNTKSVEFFFFFFSFLNYHTIEPTTKFMSLTWLCDCLGSSGVPHHRVLGSPDNHSKALNNFCQVVTMTTVWFGQLS